MLHSFVAAKLLPKLPLYSIHAQRVVPSLVTTPFLALHIPEAATKSYVGPGAPNLFAISHERPDGPRDEYFTLNHPTAKADTTILTVVPPLPFRYPLYLSITPRIWGKFPESETYKQLAKTKQYQLDQASLECLLKAVNEAGPSIPGIRETGNGEEPLPKWDTWSGDSPREVPGFLVLRRYVSLSFDLVPLKALPADLDASMFEEITLYRQLYSDYTWEGCRLVTAYIESMREALPRLAASDRIFRSPSLLLSRDRALDPLVDAIRPSVSYLLSQPIPHDGEPQINDEDGIADDWKDEPGLEMEAASIIPAVKAERVKTIALDLDTIIDSDGALQQVLATVFPPSVHQLNPKELLDLYVEKEALLCAEGLQGSAPAIIQAVARYLGATVSQSAVQDAVDRFAVPTSYDDAYSSISSLIVEGGYAIVALPGLKTRDIVSQIPGVSLAFCDAPERKEPFTWNSLLEFCKGSNPDISKNEILVVTTNLQGVAEPAALAGFPTVFIKRTGSRSVNLTIPTFSPTYTVASMDYILPILLDPSSAPPARDPEGPGNISFLPLRIRGCYQVISMLGSGISGYVWNGVQLSTGAGVAIKFETIDPTKLSTVSYEAAIYAQLEGVRGVPRIHWSGIDHNAHVLVMDKLGPNLEKLRRFCRGALSLKTVLMLAEQMLTTIEEIHARGIIVRDIKPENSAMGLLEEYKCLYLFDMGLRKHMPFRDGRGGIGTPRYASHNVHFGLEPSRRDDVEAIGISLLYLLHSRLPWQGIYAPDILSKLKRIGEMKRGKPFTDLLARSPAFFTPFFEHCRSLAFEEKPDYAYLRKLLQQSMEERGWEYDWEYDWWSPGERGTLLPDEYKLDKRFVQPVRHCQDVL